MIEPPRSRKAEAASLPGAAQESSTAPRTFKGYQGQVGGWLPNMDLKSIVIIALTLAVILGGRHMADEIARRLEAIPPADVELLARPSKRKPEASPTAVKWPSVRS